MFHLKSTQRIQHELLYVEAIICTNSMNGHCIMLQINLYENDVPYGYSSCHYVSQPALLHKPGAPNRKVYILYKHTRTRGMLSGNVQALAQPGKVPLCITVQYRTQIKKNIM
jgi:hypothetical protein